MLFLALLLTITPAPEPTPTLGPSPVVERLVTMGPRLTRVSLFDNRMAVLSISGKESEPFFRQLTLSEQEYVVYVTAISGDGAIAVGTEEYLLASWDSKAVVRIYLENGGVREIVYAPASTVGLPLRRILDALDDIERQLVEISPSFEELRHWQPQTGDLVELYDGQRAKVIDILDGTVVLETPGNAIVVTEEQRPDVIRRLLTRDQP